MIRWRSSVARTFRNSDPRRLVRLDIRDSSGARTRRASRALPVAVLLAVAGASPAGAGTWDWATGPATYYEEGKRDWSVAAGEMADADFGYVGSGPGKIDLYVGQERVERGIPDVQAVDRLAELIQSKGRWVEPDGGNLPGPADVQA